MRLLNKTGIITGPAKGMGQAISETLAREGADLVLAGRDVAAIEPVAANIRAMGRKAEIVQADVTNAKEVQAMVAHAARLFDGRIDILVNVAGTTGPIETPVWEIEPEDFEMVLRTNVFGTFLPISTRCPTWSSAAAARSSTSAAPRACAAIATARPTARRNGRCVA